MWKKLKSIFKNDHTTKSEEISADKLQEFKDNLDELVLVFNFEVQNPSSPLPELYDKFNEFCEGLYSLLKKEKLIANNALKDLVLNYLYNDFCEKYNFTVPMLAAGLTITCLAQDELSEDELNYYLNPIVTSGFMYLNGDIHYLLEDLTRKDGKALNNIKKNLKNLGMNYNRGTTGHIFGTDDSNSKVACTKPGYGFLYISTGDAYIVSNYVIEAIELATQSRPQDDVYKLLLKVIGPANARDLVQKYDKLDDDGALTVSGSYKINTGIFSAEPQTEYHFVDYEIPISELIKEDLLKVH